EVLFELQHPEAAPPLEAPVVYSDPVVVREEAEEEEAPHLPPRDSGADTGATNAQLQSLSEELLALRDELARATEAERAAAAERDDLARERDVLRAKREDLLAQLAAAKQRRRESEATLADVRDALAEAEGRADAAASSELSPERLDQIARAAASVAHREEVSIDDLVLVERLQSAVPEDSRVAQSFGILLSRMNRHELALGVMTTLPRSQLSRRASLAFLRSGVALGTPPNDVRSLVTTIRPSADEVRSLATMIAGLASARVLELTEELLAVVPDEEMAGWLATVAAHLTGRPLIGVLQLWGVIEPDLTLRALVVAVAENRLTLNDSAGATLALDLDWLTLEDREARDVAQRLATSLTRGGDVPGLYRLLEKTDHLATLDRHTIGTEIVHAIAQLVPDREPITRAIESAVRFVEDHRQANQLTDAVRRAGFVRQNLRRADEETQALAELVLTDLDRAIANSAIGQRIADEMDREALGDVGRAVSGKRFLIVGGQRQEWYDELRHQLGFSGDSEWRESSRAEPPSMHNLKAMVKAGKLDGVIVFTDFVAHKTSAIKETAAQYDVPYVNATMSKLGLIEAFRSWMRTTGG
ncbi:MAG: hypothetical protein M3452_08080, partial [Chloroflexota bacterium]|nr:hypothetical protein [Chloroflexota bacterium]